MIVSQKIGVIVSLFFAKNNWTEVQNFMISHNTKPKGTLNLMRNTNVNKRCFREK